MELQSVRDLKQLVAAEVVAPLVEEARAQGRLGLVARSLITSTPYRPTIALGIAAGDRPGQYRLAVRVQARVLARGNCAALHERLDGLTHGELDLRITGRVGKQARPAPGGKQARPRPLQAGGRRWYRRAQRPLLIGCSVAHHAITAGTLGAIVKLRAGGGTGILSNAHVLAEEGRASPGDSILQPGPADGGAMAEHAVARLHSFAELRTNRPNLVDAAIATLLPGIGFDPTTLRGAPVSLAGLRAAPVEPGMTVFKLGRTTGLTRGTVSAIEVDGVVVAFELGALRFDRQTEIEGADNEPFSRGGDSGSLIWDEQGAACGLLFAGSEQGGAQDTGLTYANDLATVLRRLRITLATA